MAQEITALNTQNSVGFWGNLGAGLGNILGAIGDVVKSAGPTATEIYKLRMQGQQLAQGTVSGPGSASAPAAPSSSPSWWQPWMGWAVVGLAALIGIILLRRR
jgi:hypothetical protein